MIEAQQQQQQHPEKSAVVVSPHFSNAQGRRRRQRGLSLLGLLLLYPHQCQAFTSAPWKSRPDHSHLHSKEEANDDRDIVKSPPAVMSRRDILALTTTAGMMMVAAPAALAEQQQQQQNLQDIALGNGRWTTLTDAPANTVAAPIIGDPYVPATFATYASRFLLTFDAGASAWWRGVVQSYSLLPDDEQRQSKLGNSFGRFARSVQLAIDKAVGGADSVAGGYTELFELFLETYGKDNDEAKRHIGLLFAILPEESQPTTVMNKVSFKTLSNSNVKDGVTESEVAIDVPTGVANPPPQSMANDFSALLPPEFECVKIRGTDAYTIYPPISLYEIGVDEEFGQTATITATGPLAAVPLQRDRPNFTPGVYALFGISGALGCAMTHSLVIPLDVVKTRTQTDDSAAATGSLIDTATMIVRNEGVAGLLLGAQATIAGYMWYGVSVYPSYTFFKRWISMSVLSPEVAIVHGNDVALIAGALAAVIASMGLTPLEAARIRTVANPNVYREKGLFGTLDVIANEDPALGWKSLYAGLPSLLTRQVIFGSIKFLAFERACEIIYRTWPILHDATWTTLMVSLVAGGFSGVLSSVVSQPADSVLTYVAQNGGGGVIEGSKIMVEKEGIGSLYRGLGSRCVWAGSIIAGQFLLYDVFRTQFGVSGDDLSQIFEVIIG